ncbi:hypothetical protein WBJ53_30130 [Spirosoma sp. SC4-14]|uniref:hypothetical protein n=1 Tax=Spirosoma sp. SC4-14 TaxID=3128900 RepID=UPI0030D3DE86
MNRRFLPGFRSQAWWGVAIHYTFFALSCSFLYAQAPRGNQLTGTWIGVHAEWDLDFVCPLPTYLQLNADGSYRLGMVDGSASPHISTWAIEGDSVRLDTIHFAPGLVTRQNDLLRIGTAYPMLFRRFTDIAIDSALVYQKLAGRVWQSDSLLVSLYKDGKVSLENTRTKQRTAHFWQLSRFGQSVFLTIRGNQYNRDGNYKPLWQVASVSPQQAQLIGWDGEAVHKKSFKLMRALSATDVCQPSGFQTCDVCFRQIWREVPMSRTHKRYDLTKLFFQQYQPVFQVGQSGLIRIQFVVNCQGERGLFSVSGYGEDYCPKRFDSRITDQLLALCRDRVFTDDGSPSLDNSSNDIAVSLTFRLKDGRLIDMLP